MAYKHIDVVYIWSILIIN